ncbi:GlxA family transcriptional regulator [Nonomuraea guangzhouensis]|uniref:GlxA family transcriptional regulator n=1 Tax=Nonomuraea guangzhouensis TaxID=1291555 RepID=A0ABW4G962_9ACTN|nr:helix-turn-helix domain-containing protein [Nonomuraea guangzhouensis]
MSSEHRVVALASPPLATFELSCAAEVFATVRPGLARHYDFRVCAETPGPVPTLAGYSITVTEGLTALESADTVVIPGWQTRTAPAAVLSALRRAYTRGARIAAICSGAFVLAQAGLLDGRRATTHWRLTAELAERFPAVTVDSDVLYVDHGDVATSAGTSAGIDLCLHLVRADHGAAYAAKVARHMVMPPHREGGQLQYAIAPSRARVPDSLAPLLGWAAERLGEPLTVDDLAARAGVSARTLARMFAAQLGTSPGQWVLAQRIAGARALLEETDLSVDAIAARVGLSSATNLRRRFHDVLRTTPAAYRRAFHLRARTNPLTAAAANEMRASSPIFRRDGVSLRMGAL